MDYPFMKPPLEFDSFEEMTPKKAQLHFDWYLEEVPKRLDLLKKAYAETTGEEPSDLDLTPSSLVHLWRWFLLQIERVHKSAEELAEERANTPEWLHEFTLGHKMKPSSGTLCIAMDIAIYFSEVFIRNHDNLYWNLRTKPKKDEYLNRPIVIGFSKNMVLDSGEILNNLLLKSINGDQDEKALIDLYYAWCKFI